MCGEGLDSFHCRGPSRTGINARYNREEAAFCSLIAACKIFFQHCHFRIDPAFHFFTEQIDFLKNCASIPSVDSINQFIALHHLARVSPCFLMDYLLFPYYFFRWFTGVCPMIVR
jgi:hypothetical protein